PKEGPVATIRLGWLPLAINVMIAERAEERLRERPATSPAGQSSRAVAKPHQPRIYFGLPSAVYHTDPFLGSTDLKRLLKERFRRRQITRRGRRARRDALVMGRHSLPLPPPLPPPALGESRLFCALFGHSGPRCAWRHRLAGLWLGRSRANQIQKMAMSTAGSSEPSLL